MLIFDVRDKVNRPIFQSTVKTGKHSDPVWQAAPSLTSAPSTSDLPLPPPRPPSRHAARALPFATSARRCGRPVVSAQPPTHRTRTQQARCAFPSMRRCAEVAWISRLRLLGRVEPRGPDCRTMRVRSGTEIVAAVRADGHATGIGSSRCYGKRRIWRRTCSSFRSRPMGASRFGPCQRMSCSTARLRPTHTRRRRPSAALPCLAVPCTLLAQSALSAVARLGRVNDWL